MQRKVAYDGSRDYITHNSVVDEVEEGILRVVKEWKDRIVNRTSTVESFS